jgi:hypothetical protein
MPLEIPTIIKDLYANYPFDGDLVAQGREHLINYKKAVVNTFPYINSAIETTQIYLEDMLRKVSFVDDSLVFNTTIYKRDSGASKSNTLRELYITKDQNILVREPLPPLGTVIESIMLLSEMQALYGNDKEGRPRWALLNGQSIIGSKLQVTSNISTLPNAFTNMLFLAAPFGSEIEAQVKPFDTNVNNLKITTNSITHGETHHTSTHTHTHTRQGLTNEGNRTNNGSETAPDNWGTARSTIDDKFVTASNTHTHTPTFTWGTETAPKALKVNYFIRIN